VWWENPFLTTTSTLAGGGRQGRVCRYRYEGDGLSDRNAHGDTGITDLDWAIGSVYLTDPRADRAHLII